MPEQERNLEHQRAAYAFQCIQQIKDRGRFNNSIKKNYRSEVMNTGNLIYRAGLMQTVAFYCSKMEDTFSEKLQSLPSGIAFPKSLSNKISYDNNRRMLQFTGIMSEDVRNNLLSLSSNTPYLTAINNLFLNSNKSSKEHFIKLTLHLLKWLQRSNGVVPLIWDEDKARTMNLFTGILNTPDERLLALSEEAKGLVVWLKRFSDAELKA